MVIPILMVVGTVVAVAGAVQQGMAAKASADYNAKVAENNAQVARWEERARISQGNENQRRVLEQGRQMAGTARAAAGVGGFDTSGSFSDVMFDNQINNSLMALDERHEARVGAWNSRVDANRFQAQAGLSRMEGRNAMTGAMFNAGSSLLSGASSSIGAFQSAGGAGRAKTTF
jgi:hypothetical protein